MSRRGLMITGIALLAFSAYLLAFLLPDFVRSSAGPQVMTMREAATAATDLDQYVTITDGRWDCETLTYIRGRSSTNRSVIETRFTELFRTDETGEIVMLVTLSGEVTCDELTETELSGYLQRMSSAREQELRNEVRLARFIHATDYLEFCDYCGPTNSLIGVGFGFFFALAAIGLIVLGWRQPPSQAQNKQIG